MTSLSPVTPAGALLGEGPTWDERDQQLLWVDIWGGLLHATALSGATSTRDLGAPLSSVVLASSGALVVTAGLCVLSVDGDEVRHLADLPEDPCLRANDAAVDPAGRLWVGTMTMPQRPAQPGSLFRLDGDKPVRVLEDLALANGLAWSPDGETMYVVDSLRQVVNAHRFDPDDGSLGPSRVLVDVPPHEGMPDGITVDTEGCLWVALARGGVVRRYSPAGSLLEEIALPVRFPTSVALGGPELDQLFVTTGVRPLPMEERPAAIAAGAGSLFVGTTAVPGLPTHRMELS